MMVYVDPLENWGWKLRGHVVSSCHMFSDTVCLQDLHKMALEIGMHSSWFQNKEKAPHYDLTARRRQMAVQLGAVEVGRREAVAIWQLRRELLSKESASLSGTIIQLVEDGDMSLL